MATLTTLARTSLLLSAALLAVATAPLHAQLVSEDDAAVVDDNETIPTGEEAGETDIVDDLASETEIVAVEDGDGEAIAYFTTMTDGANLRDLDLGAGEEAAEMAADQAASRAVEKAVNATAKGPEEQAR